MLSSFLFSTSTTASRWVSAGLRSARLCRTSLVSSVESVDVDTQQVVHGLAALHQRAEQHVGVAHQPDDVLVARVEDLGDVLQVAAASLICVVAWPRRWSRAARRRPARPGTPPVCCGSGRPAWSGLRASWSVSIRSEVSRAPRTPSRRRTASWCGRRGSRRPSSSWPRPAGSSARYIAPSSVLTLMSARVSVPKSAPFSMRKVTLTWSPSRLDLLDLADADAGDPDLVVGLQATGLGEGGVVDVATADDRQLLGVEGGQDQPAARRRG